MSQRQSPKVPDPFPKAFFSYNREDDTHAREKLTRLRARLEGEIEAQWGAAFRIYQDTIHLAWGENWQKRLMSGIDESVFFIPVITPRYFVSPTCRAELEAFSQREKELLYEELILPIYWMSINLPDDPLASLVESRNYVDFRKLRHERSDSQKMDEKIELLATQLLQRFNEFQDHQRQIGRLKVNIVTPKQSEQVGRRVRVAGTTESLPKTITPWLVVQRGGRYYHPQFPPITTTVWNGKVTVGGEREERDVEYQIHVIATSRSANEAFANYQKDQSIQRRWPGLPLPAGTKILATKTVRRDDTRAQ